MSLDKLDTVQDSTTERVLSHIQEQALGIIFTDVQPVAATVPAGKLIIFDDGSTREAHVRTGKDTVMKWTLSAL